MTDPLGPDTLLSVRDLRTHFVYRGGAAKSVDGVTFDVRRGETVCVVGESGSGKSVTSLSIMRLLAEPGRIVSGEILYRERTGAVRDLAQASLREMRALRGTEIAMIFQEPMTSLNPLFTVGDQIAEMIRLHERVPRAEALRRAGDMLELVEIPAARKRLADYPHHMSGGMRQRVMIALALANQPALLVADEPTTALDVTIQAQILDLLCRLQAEMGMGILFITHNLGVVAEIAREVVVMYAGRVVEQAPVASLFARPKHPYTEGLLASTPNPARDLGLDGERRPLVPIPGSVPPITALPPGCTFAPRCRHSAPKCTETVPPLFIVAPAHASRCLRHELL